MPKRSHHEQVVDVLRMNPKEFAQFRAAAKQFLGAGVLHKQLPIPRNKILPKSLSKIASARHPGTLGSRMEMERIAHLDKTKDFHVGGGIQEAATSIFSSLWNTVGLGPEFNDWFNFFDYDAPENRITKADQDYAKIIQQSYMQPGEREQNVENWVRDASVDDDRFSVWVDRADRQVHVALRGTKTVGDVGKDLRILLNNTSGDENAVYEKLRTIQDKYDDYQIDASAHSLGANELIEVFEQHADLNYDRINLFSPGQNPAWALDGAKDAVLDDRFYFYLNSGDIISNTFVSLIPSGRDNVHWSKPSHNPIANHGIAQWVDTI